MTESRSQEKPLVSVVIPVLNSGATLRGCLESVVGQQYSGGIEIILADGGSSDNTLEIAAEFGCVVVENALKTGEAGKAVGLKRATGEIVALIDSDNILPEQDWLERMTAPLNDPGIAGSEPIEYTYRSSDSALTRYCALLGMNDPLCFFFKTYDRMSVLSNTWTGLDITTRDRGDFIEARLQPDAIPTIGANGFLVRKALLDELRIGDYLFDVDLVHNLVAGGHNRFAKVKTGIVHLYGSGLRTFGRKQLRRVRDFHYYSSRQMRQYPWSRQKKLGLARFVLYCVLVIPLILQSLRGYVRRPDPAWFLHVPACLMTLGIYTWGFVEGKVRPREQERAGWSQ